MRSIFANLQHSGRSLTLELVAMREAAKAKRKRAFSHEDARWGTAVSQSVSASIQFRQSELENCNDADLGYGDGYVEP